MPAEEAVEDVLALPRHPVGDSMIKAAICNGDIFTVRRQDVTDHGDIVAAPLEDETTVKHLRRDSSRVWLMARSPAYEPILGENATPLGKVVVLHTP